MAGTLPFGDCLNLCRVSGDALFRNNVPKIANLFLDESAFPQFNL